jgi:hypothetical protein
VANFVTVHIDRRNAPQPGVRQLVFVELQVTIAGQGGWRAAQVRSVDRFLCEEAPPGIRSSFDQEGLDSTISQHVQNP